MVPAASIRIPRVLMYSGPMLAFPSNFNYGAFTLFGRPSLAVRLSSVRLPCMALLPLTSARFGLLPFRSPLLGISFLFSSPTGTQMFHFPASCLLSHLHTLLWRGSPIRISPGPCACLLLPDAFRRSLRPSSPSSALGIHHMLFLT